MKGGFLLTENCLCEALKQGRLMMTLSQTTGYAIHALSWLENNEVRLIRDVARLTGIPQPYLAKIINKLGRCNIVASRRGHGGGIGLLRAPEEITLMEIVEAIEGKEWIAHCLLGLDDCAARGICPVPIVATWRHIREEIEKTLRETTLAEVIAYRKQTTGGKPTGADSRNAACGCG
jgi:Rrf2 family protein